MKSSVVNPESTMKHYKKSLKIINDPIQHSQNYKSIEYKKRFIMKDPKLYPISMCKGKQ